MKEDQAVAIKEVIKNIEDHTQDLAHQIGIEEQEEAVVQFTIDTEMTGTEMIDTEEMIEIIEMAGETEEIDLLAITSVDGHLVKINLLLIP